MKRKKVHKIQKKTRQSAANVASSKEIKSDQGEAKNLIDI